MSEAGAIIVLDVGKTLSKLSLWSARGEVLAKESRTNARVEMNGIAVLDTAGIAEWVRTSLLRFAAMSPVSAIIPVGHGAGVAVIRGGELAFAPLDYEQEVPMEVLADYRRQRGRFAETGSPALPQGLNIGAQLHWLDERVAGATLLPWAQYWSWFLSGVATSEVTSLGCHSDLWNPEEADFSALAKRRGWADQFAPLAKAGDVIGTLKPEFGLGETVNVHSGIHDSNAALIAGRGFPEIEGQEATILSTGTWFIAMRSPAEPIQLTALPEARDCLVNVDAYGQPVPSARFMGGREIELLGSRIDLPDDQAEILDELAAVLESGAMLLPSFAAGCGPFPNRAGAWVRRRSREGGGLGQEESPTIEQTRSEAPAFTAATPDEQRAAIALYIALVADSALDLIGAKDRLLIEGRFAKCDLFTRALATLRPNTKVFAASAEADVSLGALRLIDPAIKPKAELARVAPLGEDLATYRLIWRNSLGTVPKSGEGKTA